MGGWVDGWCVCVCVCVPDGLVGWLVGWLGRVVSGRFTAVVFSFFSFWQKSISFSEDPSVAAPASWRFGAPLPSPGPRKSLSSRLGRYFLGVSSVQPKRKTKRKTKEQKKNRPGP